MSNTGYVLSGQNKVRSGLKSRIIIKKPPNGILKKEREMVRIPTDGPPTHPGEMLLEEFLKPLGMTQADLAGKIGVSYPRINEVVRGKRGVTPDTALRLEKLFGMEAQFWLNLQLAWDLYHAAHSPAARKIRKIKRLPSLATAGIP
jgi:addiction module HigA family antidote